MRIKYEPEKNKFEKWIDNVNSNLDFIFGSISTERREELERYVEIFVYPYTERIKIMGVLDQRWTSYDMKMEPYYVASSMFGFATQIYFELENKE